MNREALARELEACPFCRAPATFTPGYWKANRWHPAKIMCENKHTFRNFDKALEKDPEVAAACLTQEWNTRPDPSALKAKADALVKASRDAKAIIQQELDHLLP
ncbi:MAG: hypothetical protein PHE36_04420 [Novosphingobium sp.]|nr:hypothetical protein [Novosphingobium sp.]